MQQILNYTTKVERVQHLYQEQGEINKILLNEDFEELTEKLKEQVTQTEESTVDNKIKDKEESNNSNQYHSERKAKEEKEKKEIKVIEEPESNIDIKV